MARNERGALLMFSLLRGFDRFNHWASMASGAAATLLLAGMLAIMIVHVLYRYVLGDSFGWTEELARFMMVWMAFLYFPAAHKRGLHVSLEIATSFFKGSRPWRLIQLGSEILIFIALIWCVRLGFDRIERTGNSVSLSLGIEMAKVYAVLPLAFGLTALSSFERILLLAISLFKPSVYPVETDLATDDIGRQ